MLICLDAGHYIGTSGKRCLKALDPNETREWVLNARIADKVQVLLKSYACTVMRVDDVSGRTEVTLSERVRMANQSEADVYISIHHNAGIHGGAGGGIVIYVAPKCSEQSKVLQEAVYRRAVAATGLSGNRSNPTPAANLYVLKHTDMPAILGEFGFMDSSTDAPVILTEEYADQVAHSIVAALVEVYDLKEVESDMTAEEVRKVVREELVKFLDELAEKPVSDWAKTLLDDAKAKGITDGSRPQSFATRQEVALMVRAALK